METVIETRKGSIKIVRFNRPEKKNAIYLDMYLRVTKILNDAARDDEISVLVLTGTGDYYSSGNDLIEAVETPKDMNLIDAAKNFIYACITFPKILIAIVNGPAIGIAATTLALCDIVYAAENAFFSTPFTQLGFTAEGCSTFTFPKLMGDRKAAEMLIYGGKMSAKEALECGFVNYVYKPEELQNKVWDKIVEVSQFPQQGMLLTKSLLRRNIQDELIKTNEIEIQELKKVWTSEAHIRNMINFDKGNPKKSNL